MDLKKLESILKNDLSSLPNQEDPDLAWNKIAGELDQLEKKKRRPLFFVLLFLGVGLAIGYLFNPSNTMSSDPESPVLVSKKKMPSMTNSQKNETPPNLSNQSSVPIIKPIIIDHQTMVGKDEKRSKQELPVVDLTNKAVELKSNNIITSIRKEEVKILPMKKIELIQPKRSMVNIDDTTYFKLPPKNLWKDHWAINVEGGVHQHLWNIKNNSSIPEDYSNLRNTTESSYLGYQGGFSINKISKKGWSFGAGFFYKRFWNKVSFNSTQTDSVLKNNVLVTIIVEPGTTNVLEEIYGSGKVKRTTYRNLIHFNQFDQIQIPLSFGYRSRSESRPLFYGVDYSFSTNIWLKRKGVVLDEFTQTLLLEDEHNNLINANRFNWSTNLSFLIGYEITNSTSIFLRSGIGYSISNWLSPSSNFAAHPVDFGLSLGIKRNIE